MDNPERVSVSSTRNVDTVFRSSIYNGKKGHLPLFFIRGFAPNDPVAQHWQSQMLRSKTNRRNNLTSLKGDVC